MDLPIIILWASPLSFLGTSSVILIFYFIFRGNFSKQTIAPDGTPQNAASHLGLFCLPMSHKKDARLIRVKY